eukprot:1054415-Pelagomonas_calceolata.AAC.1
MVVIKVLSRKGCCSWSVANAAGEQGGQIKVEGISSGGHHQGEMGSRKGGGGEGGGWVGAWCTRACALCVGQSFLPR